MQTDQLLHLMIFIILIIIIEFIEKTLKLNLTHFQHNLVIVFVLTPIKKV